MKALASLAHAFVSYTLIATNVYGLSTNNANNLLSKNETIAINNLAHESAICSVYFSLMAQGIKNTGKADIAEVIQIYEEASVSLITLSAYITSIEVTQARLENAMNEMAPIVINQLGGWSILINRYHERCLKIINSPDDRFNFWLEQNQ